MPPNSDRVVIGRFGKTKGIKGFIRLYSFANPFDKIIDYPLTDSENNPITIDEWSIQNDYLIVKLPQFDSPEAAASIVNHHVYTNRDAFPALTDGTFYWHDLVGCQVENHENESLGQVTSLMDNGAQDILIVENENTKTLIPFVDAHIQSVDLDSKLIRVLWKPM